MKMPKAVKIFKNRCAELGEPNKLLLFAKLVNPTFSCGIRKKIIKIKNRLTKYPINLNILLIYLLIVKSKLFNQF
jgi:hypothetical protein